MLDSELTALIDDRPADRVFRVHRAIFDEPAVFDLEMARIFEGGWVFLGLADQAPEPHSFFTTTAGRVPVLVMRDGQGVLRGFVNSCPHKGSRVAQTRCGKARMLVCPYHSWSFDSAGRNKGLKWKNAGAYAPAFEGESHDLPLLGAFAEYRGFLFGSATPNVPPLAEHLGEAARMLDLVADQSPDGPELIPGGVTFTYEANWKLQLENCSDQYHFTSAHPSYIQILDKRKAEVVKDFESAMGSQNHWREDAQGIHGGSMSFAGGHALNWGIAVPNAGSALFESNDRLAAEHGEAVRDWMFHMRNLTIFPNLQIAENAASQLRVIRPLAHNRTEMRTWCIGPKGESREARRQRIRQYEDFFNPSGMATPDDTVCYENCQKGYAARSVPWLQGYSRGMMASTTDENPHAAAIGMKPERSVLGSPQLCDETLYHSYYREWARRMTGAQA